MSEQHRRVLIAAQLELRRSLAQEDDLQGFHLTFQVGAKGRGEEEVVRAWVDSDPMHVNHKSLIHRNVQRRFLGSLDPTSATTRKLCELYSEREVPMRLREFLYLWTDGLQVNEQVRPIIEQNLWHLQRHHLHSLRSDERPLAFAQVYVYDSVPTHDEEEEAEVLRDLGCATTEAGLRQIVLELPFDATCFQIHMCVSNRIVGNAEYQVEEEIDQKTGKRELLLVSYEFGACEKMYRLFSDLYNVDEEFQKYVALLK